MNQEKDISAIFFGEETEEEKIKRKELEKEELASKGFLPKNEEYNEEPSVTQEEVESNPKQYIIEECLPACQELWRKNIYTFMVSDHLNEGQCWIEIKISNLSEENLEILNQLNGEDLIIFSYHEGSINFGVKCVGLEGQQKLLALAKQFKMQDVPCYEAYLEEEEFLMNCCDCYEEYDNPNYYYMPSPWEVNVDKENMSSYWKKYNEWESSEYSKPKLRRFDASKVTKPTSEYAKEKGMIFEDGRVYRSMFHYQKHLNYINYLYENEDEKGSHR